MPAKNKNAAKGGKAAKGNKGKNGAARKNSKASKNGAAAPKDDEKSNALTIQQQKEYRESKAMYKIPNIAELQTDVHELQSFGTMYDSDIDALKATFEMFERLLKQRKKECLNFAREQRAKENSQTDPILVNVEGTKSAINSIGTELGVKEWQLTKETLATCNILREIMVFEAESKKSESELDNIRSGLSSERKEMEQKEDALKQELSVVEPVLNEAKKALKNIERSRLDELRRLPKAAPIVENVVKSLLVLTGVGKESEFKEWNVYKKNLTFTFIQSLETFEAKDISEETKNVVTKYVESDEFTPDNLKKANTTCPALVAWMKAQLKYSEYVPKVVPVQQKVQALQSDLETTKAKEHNLQLSIAELQKRIAGSRKDMRNNINKVVKLQDEIKDLRDAAANQ